MAEINVHAGDFVKGGSHHFAYGKLILRTAKRPYLGETISANQLASVEIASEDSVKRIGGTVGWGLAGAAIFGPVGLLAGLLLGGRKTQVTFVAQFKDGRRLLATTDSKTYTRLMAACFNTGVPVTPTPLPAPDDPEQVRAAQARAARPDGYEGSISLTYPDDK